MRREMKKWKQNGIRKLACAVLFGMLLFLNADAAVVCAAGDYQIEEMQMQGSITTDSALNVRSGPGRDYAVIDTVGNDTILNITGQADNGWYQVEIDGKTGYVSDKYVEAVQAPEEAAPEAGEPEEGYRGLRQSPYVLKIVLIGVGIIVLVLLIILTVKSLRRDEDEDDEDEDDDDADDADDDTDDADDDDADDDTDDVDDAGNTGRNRNRRKRKYVLREEDYRVQIDPSFFEDKEPIEQPAMVTGYLERKKIEEEAEKRGKAAGRQKETDLVRQAGHGGADKQQELDMAMKKLDELQKEIERLKRQ